MQLQFTNSSTKKKETFIPINPNHITMYVCGPTVYNRPHIGNIRSSVVFDLLYRLLKAIYHKVTYVRNITDVDDKIINQALLNNEPALDLTLRVTKQFHDDLKLLNCLTPDYEPKATENIQEIINIIKKLIELNIAYTAENHVLFSVNSFSDYGKLSNKNLDEMIAGSRVEVAPYKKDPMDFVLWKPAKQQENVYFDSPWGKGRPGWHIECSAMSTKYLGEEIDIHGGGIDLIFPHHENEIAQSVSANKTNKFVNYWIHNGFLTVDGEKMSKSIGNITTLQEILDKNIAPMALRYFYLTTHYRKPLDFNMKAINDAKKSLEKFALAININNKEVSHKSKDNQLKIIEILSDDLNTPKALSYLHELANESIKNHDHQKSAKLKQSCEFLGLDLSYLQKEQGNEEDGAAPEIIKLADERLKAKQSKNWAEADALREKIKQLGYDIVDTKDSYKLIQQ